MWAIALRLHGVSAASCSALRYARAVTARRLQEHRARPGRRRHRPGHLRHRVQAAQFLGFHVEDQSRAGAEGRRATGPGHADAVRLLVSRSQCSWEATCGRVARVAQHRPQTSRSGVAQSPRCQNCGAEGRDSRSHRRASRRRSASPSRRHRTPRFMAVAPRVRPAPPVSRPSPPVPHPKGRARWSRRSTRRRAP
jgi:hypothetical protein